MPESDDRHDDGRGASRRATRIGLPAGHPPAYTLGGTGGGIAFTDGGATSAIVAGGLAASPITQVLVEQSLLGWKEVEYEVMRDGADNCITICNMENFDPMGVHTGDSIVVAPSQTLTDKEYQMLRTARCKIIRALGIEGGCNVQFALAPRPDIVPWAGPDGDRCPYYVIEVNPRVSRSLGARLARRRATRSRASPRRSPSARRSTRSRTPSRSKTTAAFEPALDYCVVKIPRWPFDKFAFGDRTLGTQMKATGEVMAIDRTFEAALQKAVRSLEIGGRSLLWEDPDVAGRPTPSARCTRPTSASGRCMAALRRGARPARRVARRRASTPGSSSKLQNIVAMEQAPARPSR